MSAHFAAIGSRDSTVKLAVVNMTALRYTGSRPPVSVDSHALAQESGLVPPASAERARSGGHPLVALGEDQGGHQRGGEEGQQLQGSAHQVRHYLARAPHGGGWPNECRS